jgi:hypothetical protein
MGEALHGGHEMLNHLGRVIRVTRRTIRTLDIRNYLCRDHRSGLLQPRPEFYPMFKELERGDRRGPHRHAQGRCRTLLESVELAGALQALSFTQDCGTRREVGINASTYRCIGKTPALLGQDSQQPNPTNRKVGRYVRST